jgi:hypothetical protein
MNCDHLEEEDDLGVGRKHLFVWPEELEKNSRYVDFHGFRRNVFNPLDPVCKRCRKSIGELLGCWKLKEKAG